MIVSSPNAWMPPPLPLDENIELSELPLIVESVTINAPDDEIPPASEPAHIPADHHAIEVQQTTAALNATTGEVRLPVADDEGAERRLSVRPDVEDPIAPISIDDRSGTGPDDRHVAPDIQVTRDAGVLVLAGQCEGERAGRDVDGVTAAARVGLHDGGAQPAAVGGTLADAVAGRHVDFVHVRVHLDCHRRRVVVAAVVEDLPERGRRVAGAERRAAELERTGARRRHQHDQQDQGRAPNARHESPIHLCPSRRALERRRASPGPRATVRQGATGAAWQPLGERPGHASPVRARLPHCVAAGW